VEQTGTNTVKMSPLVSAAAPRATWLPRLAQIMKITQPIKGKFSSRSNIPSNPTNKNDMSKEEVLQKLEEANETMKAYYSYPPDKVIKMKKARFNERYRDSSFYIQLGLGTWFAYLRWLKACYLLFIFSHKHCAHVSFVKQNML
jgi:hypothetical protein